MTGIRVVLCGVGGVGRNLVRVSRERPAIQVVAGCSRNVALQGRDLGELSGGAPTGARVVSRGDALATPADLLLIATTSFLAEVEPDIHLGIDAGLDVVCTAEEMASPWETDPAAAARIDAHARERGVTVIGAGANPGYIYEVVGLALTGAVWRVDRITVRRVVDLSGFSATVLGRLGIGFEPGEFVAKVRDGVIHGHIGFPHTIRTFARRLGTTVERIDETIEPLLAGAAVATSALEVDAGRSAGLLQRTTGIVNGAPWFTAEFLGHVALSSIGLSPRDAYEIDGLPNVRGVVEPGFNPQWTTAGALANYLPLVVAAPPGLISVTDLRIPTPWS
jgi:4-hydroxy-tetrahydrodipicolinate reductase